MKRAGARAAAAPGAYHPVNVMAIELTHADYAPPAELQFQHWGERPGMPYSALRPLTPDAARRVWRHTAAAAAGAWADGGRRDAAAAAGRFDLREVPDWSESSVRDWLLTRVADRDLPVLACFQPTVAVRLPWGVLCDHWLVLLWTGGCVWPVTGDWVLIHDGDLFEFGHCSVIPVQPAP